MVGIVEGENNYNYEILQRPTKAAAKGPVFHWQKKQQPTEWGCGQEHTWLWSRVLVIGEMFPEVAAQWDTIGLSSWTLWWVLL